MWPHSSGLKSMQNNKKAASGAHLTACFMQVSYLAF
jgi:hypothetical protein